MTADVYEQNACFDWASSFYDETRKIPSDLIDQITETISDKIIPSSSSRFLEIGIGTGRLSIPIAKKFNLNMILGVDISRKMLSKCLEKSKQSNNVHLILGDGNYLPFSKSLDVVITSHVLHLVEDHFSLVNSLTNSLSPKGTYVDIEAYVCYQKTIPFKIFYDKLEEEGYHRFMKAGLIRKEIMVFLKRRNWMIEEINLISHQDIRVSDLVRFIRDRVFSHQRAIPNELFQSGLDHLYNEIENRNINPLKTIAVPATSNITIFRKKDS